MAFTLHFNISAGIWFDGQAVIPPAGDPDTVENVQTLKPKIAYNEWQHDNFGDMFFVCLCPADVYPKDPIMDPNGLGSTFKFPSSPAIYYYCAAVVPLYSEGDLIAWHCLLRRAYPT